MRRPQSESSPYDFYFKLKPGLFDKVSTVHVNIDGVAKWWPVKLIISKESPTYVVISFCGKRVLLESTNTLTPESSRNIIGYRYVHVLDKDGNVAKDKYGLKIMVKAVYGSPHQIKRVNLDHVHPQVKRLVEYK